MVCGVSSGYEVRRSRSLASPRALDRAPDSPDRTAYSQNLPDRNQPEMGRRGVMAGGGRERLGSELLGAETGVWHGVLDRVAG
ncbi:hypothetical protein XNA1_460022 [Xenorhabdus nematophila str. Anatoliense]|nr:hypothetical protein XNA1_4460021 [Xenorhabdus nematophila str. Anatoliense]CEE94348.1 hypothetical protein XNA1_460022 [Xenorhabdus nematophila str. Anatoliense]